MNRILTMLTAGAALTLAAQSASAQNPPGNNQWQQGVPNPSLLADRWVGTRLGPQCPPAVGWTVSNPFAGLVHPNAAVLGKACQYVWEGPGIVAPDTLPAESGRVNSAWLSRDSWTLVGQSDLSTYLQADLVNNWRLGSGSDTFTTLPAQANAGTTPLVAVIDSCEAAYGCPETDDTLHGYMVTQIIENITHPTGDPTDLAEVTHARALTSTYDGTGVVSDADGGSFGTLMDLATAIAEAVHDWKVAGVERPLIINLSLGWQRKYGTRTGPFGPSLAFQPSAFVAEALRYARCHGALIFAATGNRTLDDEDDGMLAPALWTSQLAPTGGVCEAKVGTIPRSPALAVIPAPTGPLIFSVSASNALGELAATARPDSAANFLAPGIQIVTDTGGTFNSAFSGSSASTAILSGAAAVIWAYRPDLTADEVAEYLYTNGPIRSMASRGANTGGGAPLLASRSIDLCAAVSDACSGSAPHCPVGVLSCSALPTTPTPAGSTVTDIRSSVTWDDEIDATGLLPLLGCLRGPVFSLTGAALCPLEANAAWAEAGVWPQPIDPMCDVCGVMEDYVLAKIRTSLSTSIENPVLARLDASKNLVAVSLEDLGITTLKAGESYEIKIDESLKDTSNLMIGGDITIDGKTVTVLEDIEELE